MSRKKDKKSKISKILLIILIVIFVILGIFTIKDSVIKINKSINISEKILNIYLNSNK